MHTFRLRRRLRPTRTQTQTLHPYSQTQTQQYPRHQYMAYHGNLKSDTMLLLWSCECRSSVTLVSPQCCANGLDPGSRILVSGWIQDPGSSVILVAKSRILDPGSQIEDINETLARHQYDTRRHYLKTHLFGAAEPKIHFPQKDMFLEVQNEACC